MRWLWYFIFRRGLNNWDAHGFWCPIHELFLLVRVRPSRIDDYVLGVTWGSAEKIEDGDAVGGVCLAEWITMHIYI